MKSSVRLRPSDGSYSYGSSTLHCPVTSSSRHPSRRRALRRPIIGLGVLALLSFLLASRRASAAPNEGSWWNGWTAGISPTPLEVGDTGFPWVAFAIGTLVVALAAGLVLPRFRARTRGPAPALAEGGDRGRAD